jgi:hypothetical protein
MCKTRLNPIRLFCQKFYVCARVMTKSMKHRAAYVIILGCLLILVFSISSCKVKESNPPVVQLNALTGFVYEDTTLVHGTTFGIWVYAYRDGVNDLLESGKISRSINSGPDSTLQSMTIVTSQFSQIYSYIAGDSGNVERYIFTFANQNGVADSATVTIIDK